MEVHGTIEPFPVLRWRGMHELFVNDSPLLVFVKDGFDEEWGTVPDDVIAMLETMQSTSNTRVRIFSVDFRVDPDFLGLFGLSRGTTIVRRRAGQDRFDMLSPELGYGALIEFCRELFEQSESPARLVS